MASRTTSVMAGLLGLLVLAINASPNALSAEEAKKKEAPRLGRYIVTMFSGFTRTPSFFHNLDLLPGMKYSVSNFSDKVQSEGTYELDENNDIVWLTGLYKDEKGYFGKVTIKGDRHEIRLKGTLYARNDSPEKEKDKKSP
jgi:hypothetical protein